jgi:hypothetical protein
VGGAQEGQSKPGDAVTFPALAVLAQPSTVHQVMTSVRDCEIPIVFAYLVKILTRDVNQRHASYTTRALLRFLRRMADNAGASFRTRNGVQLINPIDDVRQGEAIQPWDKALAIAATEITWLARETLRPNPCAFVEIKTKKVTEIVDGKEVKKIVPVLDEHGREIETSLVEIPRDVEAKGGAAIDAFVADARRAKKSH